MMNRLFYKALTLAFGLASLAWFAPAGAAEPDVAIPIATDLRQDGQTALARRVPVVILFSTPNCRYCERVRQEFLLPMMRNPVDREKFIPRQVELQGKNKLVDFSGKTVSHAQFAKSHKVTLTPTVRVFDPDGIPVGEALVGLSTPDFYGAYLDQAVNEGLEKIRATRQ